MPITQKAKVACYTLEKSSRRLNVVLFPAGGNVQTGPQGSIEIDKATEEFPQSPGDKTDRALLNFYRQSPFLGCGINIENSTLALLFAINEDERAFMLRHLSELGLITGYRSTIPCRISLTAKGIERAADLERGLYGPTNLQAFVAMSFDSALDSVYENGLKLGISHAGFSHLRVDACQHNGKICDVIVSEIRRSKFLVADFTGHRAGVYFESGLMIGLGRPVIFTCKDTEISTAHFDTRQYNHIVWSDEAELRLKLKNHIQATIPI